MDFDKLAPSLAATYDRYLEEERRPGPLVRTSVMSGLVSARQRAKPVRVVVKLECEPGASLDDLAGEGVELNEGGRAVRTALVEIGALDRVAAHPGIRRIAPAYRMRPLLDVAQRKAGVTVFRNTSHLTGQGVLVGIVDTGIDPRHPDFAGRIERVWDQTILGGSGVPEGRYGEEFPGNGQILSRDTEGHGTHVAGIAAGVDGVAPGARIVMVKTDFDDAHIIDGIQYIFRVGRELNLPVVLNLSLGGHFDPHDGTDAMSQAIEEEVGPGRIVCCAAGNEGDDDIHIQLTVPKGAVRSIPCHPGNSPVFAVNGWYPPSDRIEVAVVSPNGATTPFQPVKTTGRPTSRHILPEGLVEITTPGPDPVNGDLNFFATVQSKDGEALGNRPWQLVLRGATGGQGRVDAWILGGDHPVQFSGPRVQDSMKVGSPGAASSAVTVACHATRVRWTDAGGTAREATWLQEDDIASFSSEGPRRDGAAKPDITAPGAMIISAFSRDTEDMPAKFVVDSKHLALQGTSMASPFVAGLAALLLEREPNLDREKLMTILRAKASFPGGAPGDFDPKWGNGLIDATDL
ncbi:S8 family serine peptidase [Embleya sp. NBC_00888]|uniref:S8 family serine peptidase n=1 Tax=Embleya sp. NBC_00888 TaxID=2975960 RepID=UPI003864787E